MARMALSDFPRPPEDNGRGVHWSTRIYHPVGDDLQHWIDVLLALQIKWIKLLDDGGGSSLNLCEQLLEHGMMPVVRLYRSKPNPDHMSGREIDTVRRLAQAGVSYFESNNEPDLPAEWEGNSRPENWLDIVVDNFIWDADAILDAGGLPAFPSMGPRRDENPVGMVVERGRKDLFEKGAWVAVHNYTLNHPLDYPDDDVNQEGRPLTQEEYDHYQKWQYSHLTYEEVLALGVEMKRDDYDKYQRWGWDGRSMEMINEQRERDKNPGDTVFEDGSCFRGYEVWGYQVQEALGFYVPLISTEGGPVVGWGDDGRYAKNNPTTHAEWQMGIIQFMQDEAPPWYFSCCTWLLASKGLGDFNPTWDQMSWFTHAWDQQFDLYGELPVLQMLRDTPALVRHELRDHANQTPRVEGFVRGKDGTPQAGHTLSLLRGGNSVARTQSDEDGFYALHVQPGEYDLFVDWVGTYAHNITLTDDDIDVIDVEDLDTPGEYVIAGRVLDASDNPMNGVEVELRRNGVTHAFDTSEADGIFDFQPGVAGEYLVTVPGGGALAVVTEDDPAAEVDVIVNAAGEQRYVLTEKRLLSAEETGNNRIFYGWVVDAAGQGLRDIELEMGWADAEPDTNFPRTRTGRNPSKPNPDGYYEFLHSPGVFFIRVVQEDFESDLADDLATTDIPGREDDPITWEVNFQLRASSAASPLDSVVEGSIPGGRHGQVVRLWDNLNLWDTELDARRLFRFEELPAGVFNLELAGIGIIARDLLLDGTNQIDIEFPLLGAIIGQVLESTTDNANVKLISETYGFVRHGSLTPNGMYRFTNLPAGIYRIEKHDAMLTGLVSDGKSVLQAPPLVVGERPIPDGSKISGRVLDYDGRQLSDVAVMLHQNGELLDTTTTDQEGGYAFENLQAGSYDMVITGTTVAENVQVDGINDVSIDLRYNGGMPPGKTLNQYYLLGMADPALQPALLRLIAPWLAKQPPGVSGFSVLEAGAAANVTVLGDGISDETVAALQAGGSQVQDLRMNLTALAEMIATWP